MKKSLLVVCALISMLICAGSLPAAAGTLWYNGDFDGVSGQINQINTGFPTAAVYDDFLVPSGGWTINTVWSNNFVDTTVSQAHWEIRSGVSQGDGGTLVASGTDSATQTATGRYFDYFGMNEYTIQVSGLNVNLGPGTYWLNVSPMGSGSMWWRNATTSGANAIGQPPAGNYSFFYVPDPDFNIIFQAMTSEFSMGVGEGSQVPLPPSAILLGSGLLGLAGWRRFRKG
jgi:hypothetical protein